MHLGKEVKNLMSVELIPTVVSMVMDRKSTVLKGKSRNDAEIDRLKANLELLNEEVKVDFVVSKQPQEMFEFRITLLLMVKAVWVQTSLERVLADTSLQLELEPHEPT